MLVQRDTIGFRDATEIEDDSIVDNPREPIRGQMMRSLLRNNDEVRVGHAIPMNQVAYALEVERFPHPSAYRLCQGHDVGRDGIGKVREMVNVLIRDDDALARGSRVQRHER